MLLLALLIASLLAVSADAQDREQVRFTRISVNEGLSQSRVTAVLQDSDGYMWFGTQDGLNRYDGYDFTIFKHNPDDENSLSHNHITSIYEDRSNMLWIGTTDGLNRYDKYTGEIKRYLPDPENPSSLSSQHVTAVLQQRDGTIWVCTLNGLNQLNDEAGEFRQFRYDPYDTTTISSNTVRTILEDRSGNLWVGTAFGLNRYDSSDETFKRIALGTGGLDENVITSIHEAPGEGGALWIGTWGGGFGLLSPGSQKFDEYTAKNSGLTDDRVTSVHEDLSGHVWVGTVDAGLHRFDRQTRTSSSIRHDPRDPRSLSDDRVTAILEDRQSGLWVATQSGINRLDRNAETFAHIRREPDLENTLSENMIWSVATDTSGVVWIGTFSGGLNRLDRRTGEITHFRHDPNDSGSLSSDGPLSVYVDGSGTVWVGTPRGLDRLDPSTGRFTNYVLTPKRSGGHHVNAVMTMLEDHRGTLWVGSRSGLFKFDRRKEEFQRVSKLEYKPEDEPENGVRRSRRAVREPLNVSSLHEDSGRNLWVGALGSGLYRLDETRSEVRHYSAEATGPDRLSHNSVQAVFERPQESGVLWVGTYSGGLNRLDTKTDSVVHYTEQNSKLPTNTVIGILGDDDGRLWLGTHKGLVRLDPSNMEFRLYDVDRGIQSREFNYGAAHRSHRGELFFGGINGLNAFFPDQITDDPHAPDVVLTDFKLFNTSVDFGDDSVLPRAISGVEEVELGHDQNDVSFEYVGLHYAAPHQNTYAYMLENYDQDWRRVSDRRSAIYTSLDPGEYTFRVKGANSDGVWNEEGASVRLVIRPPWWSTGWAWLLYGVALVGAIATIDRVQRRRLIAKERSRAELREIKLKAQAAEAQALVLQAENDRQTRELEEARELQLSMLPDSLPDHPMLEIAADMKTATEVGGDYYDYVMNGSGALTVVIGDATGHGANAGTMVTATKSLFNVLAGEEDLVDVVRKSNAALKKLSLRKLYMALALAKFEDYTLELVGAGMPPALVYRSMTNTVDEIPLKGMPLGTFADYPYHKELIRVEPGDTILLMTDGFPELFSSDGEMFGYKRAREVFEEVADRSPKEILSHFLRVGSSWTNGHGRDDDMTFVVMKVKEVSG
ncbi:MAG: SpoIIE family protein phosphatase [Rhodothermia bacterium]|nr:SpoIIE family protein phosphatase [Rhodothermia bacterium]